MPPMWKPAIAVVAVMAHVFPSSSINALIKYDLPVPAVPSKSILSGCCVLFTKCVATMEYALLC